MVGQHIGKYRVTEQIGRGGMGTVYRAVDETLHREVAIKVLNTDLNDPTVAKRFRAEAVTVARLNHPGIATIYELLQHDGQWLMVMEFLRGETLEALVTRAGPLSVERAADLVMQTLSALAHAHSLGVVHRDLKPANLMLAESGAMKVMDFGIARVAGGEQLTSAGFMMGTPAYMAPEQVLGQEIDARTDLYSTGLVLYHLITGKLPFSGTTPFEQAQARIQERPASAATVRPDLPAWVGQLLDIALAKEPTARFQTALLFREALRRGLSNLPINTPTPAEIPPELVATAAPSSMPVFTPAAGVPSIKKIDVPVASQPAPPPVVSVPPPTTTPGISESVPAPKPIAAPALTMPGHVASPSKGRAPLVAIAGVVVVLAGGGWWLLRSSGSSVPPPVEPQPTTVVAGATDALAPTPVSAPAPVTNPAPAAPSAPGLPRPPAAGATPEPGAVTAPVAGAPAAAVDPAAAARGGARGAAAAAADAPAVFKDARAFLVAGAKVEEQDATLSFGGGRVTLSDARGEKRYGQMAYADITAVAHTRAKNPRWYPTLAGPPSNVEMPGGLFRSDRHWFAFQSRSTYLIARVSDEDYRRLVETSNARLKVKVDTLAAR